MNKGQIINTAGGILVGVGAQGTQGPQGTQGTQGSTGAQGTQGTQGSTGPQGSKDRFYLISIGILILLLIFLAWRLEGIRQNSIEQSDELKRSIIASNVLIKESEGSYSKLVDYYKSEKDLTTELKNSNKDLYNAVKSQGEKILSLTSTVISLKGSVEEGFGKFNPTDSNQIDIALRYPAEKDPFIKWDGFVNKKTAAYRGNWSFGKLPIQIVVTEETTGLWKHRVVGPDWLLIDSLQVNSLPPDKYVPTIDRTFQLIIGGNYMKPIISNKFGCIGIGVGLSIASKHNIIFSANTNQEIGIGYYYKLKALKRNK